MFLRISLLVVGLFVAMFGGAYLLADPNRSEIPTRAEVLRLFDTVAFSGFGEEGPSGQGPILRRWTQTVRIGLIGAPEKIADEAVSWTDGIETMAELYDGLKGLDVAVVSEIPYSEAETSSLDANFRIVSIPRTEIVDLIDSGVLPPQVVQALSGREGCAVLGADAAVLADVTLFMRANLSVSQRNQCVGEGLATGLGFTIETKHAGNVFRVDPTGLRFHPLGRMAVALVYDPDLQPGMTRANALSAASAVLAEKGVPEELPSK